MNELEPGNQAQAENTAEREHDARRALLYVLHLIEEQSRAQRLDAHAWDHLRTLCFECGVSYDEILRHGIGH